VEYPEFLRYHGPYFGPNRDDPAAFVEDFGCVAQLGAQAAAPNQPLEAALLALSDPSHAPGFLRSDPARGLSLIWIVIATDTDDCSFSSAIGTTAPTTSAACARQADTLQSVEAYAGALRGLRPGNENLVIVSVLTGVAPELVGAESRAAVDFDQMSQSDAYYQRILDDPAMQATPDSAAPEQLLPACTSQNASAEPGRRLVELARRFGGNGAVASICADDYAPLLDPMDIIAAQLGAVCLPRPFVRDDAGRIPCRVFWHLPPPERAHELTPTSCSERAYLTPAGGESRQPGGQRCEVRQLAITSDAELEAIGPDTEGWYYDDFSENVRQMCTQQNPTNVAFTAFARPPIGVVVALECFALDAPSDALPGEAAACEVAQPPPRPGRAPAPDLGVGESCMLQQIPESGFAPSEVVLETGHPGCASGLCMVYELHGDPQPECESLSDPLNARPVRCATEEEVRDRAYCSCRCRSTDRSIRTCACPDGFSCVDVLGQGRPEYAGGYCVKDGTVED
jgi:hypothetical protein